MKKTPVFMKVVAVVAVVVLFVAIHMLVVSADDEVPATSPLADAPSTSADGVASVMSFSDTYNFFTDKYPLLTDENHVFQTAEFTQIYNYFLGGRYIGAQGFFDGERTAASESTYGKYRVDVKSGNHIFLIGGTWSAEVQAAIGSINDVAKEYGITAIYNFDPHLDGKANSSVDIFATVGSQKSGETNEEFTYRTYYRERGDALAKALYHWDGITDATYGDLNGDAASNTWTADDISTPSIIIWNKDGANNNPVIAELRWSTAEAQNEASFKASLQTLFDSIAADGKAQNVVSVSPSAYFMENEQNRFKDQLNVNVQILSVEGNPLYLDAEGNITETVTDQKYQYSSIDAFTANDTYTPFEVVTYEELRGMLASEGNYVIAINGLWCPNSYSALRNIHDYAVRYNLQKVYFFDPELDQTFNNGAMSIRNSDRVLVSGLYIDLFNENFTNIGLDKDFESRFDDSYRNYIASENQRRTEVGVPLLTEEEKQELRTVNAGDSGDGFSIYEKQPGYGSYDTIDGLGRDEGMAPNGRMPITNAKVVSRLQYPALIFFNKDNTNAQGDSAPVISIFEELWYSGGNMAFPGSFGEAAVAKGRIFESSEYWFNGADTPTVDGVLQYNGTLPDTLKSMGGYNYNTSNNAATPRTTHAEYQTNPTASDGNPQNTFDKRGLNTPVVSRTYWPGLNETFNVFGIVVIDSLIAQASALKADDYTADSFAALAPAIEAAEKASAEVKAANTAAKAKDDAKLKADTGWTKLGDTATVERLSSTQQIGSYEDLSETLTAAYARLQTVIAELVPVAENAAK